MSINSKIQNSSMIYSHNGIHKVVRIECIITFTNIDESHRVHVKRKFGQNKGPNVKICFTFNSEQTNLICIIGIQDGSQLSEALG